MSADDADAYWLGTAGAAWHAAVNAQCDMIDALLVDSTASGKPPPLCAGPNCCEIPRIVHHIWLGGKLPAKLQRLVDTWRLMHPAWKHCMWTDEHVAAIPWYNAAAVSAAGNCGELSDVIRYEILYALGGVYVDTDMQCIRSFDVLHATAPAGLYIGVSNTRVFELNNAVVGSVPQHEALLRIIDAVRHSGYSTGPTASGACTPASMHMHTITKTGPGCVTRTLLAGDESAHTPDGRAFVLASGDSAVATAASSAVVPSAMQDTVDAIRALAYRTFDLLMDTNTFSLEEPQRLPPSLCSFFVLPATVFYPIPNYSAESIEPMALSVSSDTWEHAVDECTAALAANEVSSREATSLLDDVTRALVSPHTLAVHYWAKTWQRPTAQLKR